MGAINKVIDSIGNAIGNGIQGAAKIATGVLTLNPGGVMGGASQIAGAATQAGQTALSSLSAASCMSPVSGSANTMLEDMMRQLRTAQASPLVRPVPNAMNAFGMRA